MAAVDGLLTEDNATRFGPEWVAAALPGSVLVEMVRGFGESLVLLHRTERLATELDHAYEAVIARWLASLDAATSKAARDAAQERGNPIFMQLRSISHIKAQVEEDPLAASQLDAEEVITATDGSRLAS